MKISKHFKFNCKTIRLRENSSKNDNVLLNGNQTSLLIKQKIRLFCTFVRIVMVSINFKGQYLGILELKQEKYSNNGQVVEAKQFSKSNEKT